MRAFARDLKPYEVLYMGLFDFFKSKKTSDAGDEPAVDKNVLRLGRVAADKHAQNYDRIDAIHGLAAMATADSAAALLKRFTFYIEPSITDQEEKDAAFAGVVAAHDAAIQPILDFCQRAESLTYPLKMLGQILPEEGYVDELLELLSRYDTEYTKNSEPKLQILCELEGKKRDDVRLAVEPFMQDVNEPVRFHAVVTVFAQDDPQSIDAICEALIEEESVRVKNKLCEGLIARGWQIPVERQSEFKSALPSGFALQDNELQRR
jgi:HEAT repeat protein